MLDATYRHVTVELRDNVQVIRFMQSRLLEEDTIREVGAELFALMENGPPRLLIHFGNVQYLASAMLGKLITLQRRLLKKGGLLAIAGLTPETREVFKISKLDTYFTIYNSEQEATAALA